MTSRKIPESAVENLVSDLEGKANRGLDNSPYTTNRILEIPQDIKLELNNGTLTLKAGSKVYVPNGFESDGTTPKFDVRIIENDVTYTQGGTLPSVPTKMIAVMNFAATAIGAFSLSICSSGSGAVGNNTLHYRIDTNYLVRTTSAGIASNMTFPLAILTLDSTGISSIDQVFNGFGYIGSIVFALPGVKVQIPNGRNADGTFKSFIKTTPRVSTWTWDGSSPVYDIIDENGLVDAFGIGTHFDYEKNFLFLGDGTIKLGCIIAKHNHTPKVENFEPFTVDSIANSNASNFSQAGRSYLSGLGMPSNRYINLTLGASGSNYTAPANGYIVLGKENGTSSARMIRLRNQTNGITMLSMVSYSTNYAFVTIPAKKGDNVDIWYDCAGKTNIFRFVYAEGEN